MSHVGPREAAPAPGGGPPPRSRSLGRNLAIGVDMGGTGIKAAVVDVLTGLRSERVRVKTPHPSTPARCIDEIGRRRADDARHRLRRRHGGRHPRGVHRRHRPHRHEHRRGLAGFRCARRHPAVTRQPHRVVNDADAAGLAEMHYGAGRGRQGTVLLITLGTGIGSALFRHGELVPNTELGHIEVHGRDAQSVRRRWRASGGSAWRNGPTTSTISCTGSTCSSGPTSSSSAAASARTPTSSSAVQRAATGGGGRAQEQRRHRRRGARRGRASPGGSWRRTRAVPGGAPPSGRPPLDASAADLRASAGTPSGAPAAVMPEVPASRGLTGSAAAEPGQPIRGARQHHVLPRRQPPVVGRARLGLPAGGRMASV